MKEVLFYCDNPSEYYKHRTYLEENGYDTSLRVSIDECIKVLKERIIDVLFIDLDSCEDEEIDIVESLNKEIDNIVIILNDNNMEKVINLFSCYELLKKPLKDEDMISAIQRFN